MLVDDERDPRESGAGAEGEPPEDEDRPKPESDEKPSSDDTPDPSGQDDDEDDFYDRDRALSTIKNLRQQVKEASKAQKELDRLKKEQAKAERQNLSELERLKADLQEKQKEYSELSSKYEQTRTRNQRSSFIESMPFDPRISRIAWAVVQDEGIEAEFDDSDKLTNKKQVVKALKEYDSEQFSTGSADGGKRERDWEGATDMNQVIRSGFGRG